MDLQKRFFACLCLILCIGHLPFSAASKPLRAGHLEAELVAPALTMVPGQTLVVGLHLKLDDEWHLYWRNPGDAGLPPSIKWSLPEGFTAGPIHWPIPEKLLTPPLASYAYSHEVILPMELRIPGQLVPGETVELKGKASWLVCREECVPGEADLSLSLQVALESRPDSKWATRFASIEYPEAANFAVKTTFDGGRFQLSFPQLSVEAIDRNSVQFFAATKGTIDHFATQAVSVANGTVTIQVPKSEYLLEKPDTVAGLLVFERTNGVPLAYEFKSRVETPAPVSAAATTSSDTTFWQALLFAFVGGLILNLMPCVLPVLSLKILGFVNHANETHTKPLYHGVVFTAGVLISFWLLAGTLLFLKAGGEQLGWGFQLQSPIFLVIVTSFIFLFGLNLLGLFEIGTGMTSAGAIATGKRGFAASFLNGVTATIVATPCTAPFMGSALGYSLAQPAWVAMLIFTSIALGMAAPYLALSASPRLLRFVPRPGKWMETFKQFLGFVLLATVVWLLWVLSIQVGAVGLILVLSALLILSIAGWIIGRWDTLIASGRTKFVARTFALALAAIALTVGIGGTSFESTATVTPAQQGRITWEAFTPQRVDELRTAGKPVFIDFTAAWCLSCQVNERVAFSSTEVQQRFTDLGIVALRADWTSRDQVIAEALATFGRNSVPLYVLYNSTGNAPIVLPEILTPGIVLEALNQINTQPAQDSPARQVTTSGEPRMKEST